MEILCYLLIILLFILIILLIKYKRIENIKYEQLKQPLKEEIQLLEQQRKNLTSQIDILSDSLSKIDQSLNKKTEELNNFLQQTKDKQLAYLQTSIDLQKQSKQRDLNEWIKSAQDAANFNSKLFQSQLKNEISIKENELSNLQIEINNYKDKRDAINKEIMREREIAEQQDFYRIQLSDSAKRDINYLLSIIDNFNNKEAIYKLIWSEYIQLPFKSMLNRILGGREPKNVIYMIQNLNSKEIYIGKTKAEVAKRWTEHIKTSLNIGSISRTKIHTALFKNWDSFSFSILEEVANDVSLNEREKYYIKFYQSDIYGYNIKSGG